MSGDSKSLWLHALSLRLLRSLKGKESSKSLHVWSDPSAAFLTTAHVCLQLALLDYPSSVSSKEPASSRRSTVNTVRLALGRPARQGYWHRRPSKSSSQLHPLAILSLRSRWLLGGSRRPHHPNARGRALQALQASHCSVRQCWSAACEW